MPGLASARESAAAAVDGRRERSLYDEDFWSWTQEQAGALRRRDLDAIDWENVIEEIETLGRSEKRGWTSLCTNVIQHLLKMEHGGRRHLRHWRREIVAWRVTMFRKLRSHPGMKGELPEMLAEAWEDGRGDAVAKLVEHAGPRNWAAEKALRRSWERRLPEQCPYALEDIAGYDPWESGAAPNSGVWPAPVALRMNEELGEDYPVRHRAPSRAAGRSR
ncbi:MAG: DUF29 domain-containing protein [Bryobacterales bacterium]|nr:DUF29 domain-containing protein [Bryobacterales bacterium]